MKNLILILFSVVKMSGCTTEDKSSIGQILLHYHNNGQFNGAILVAKAGRIVCDTALGYKDLQRKSPLGKHTSFYIASIAKPFTALAIMQLKEQGRLNFDDSVHRYITGLPVYARNIIIRQLLNHTSGIPDYEKEMPFVKDLTNQQVLEWLTNGTQLDFTPGDRFEYSNTGYILLSLIIEKVSGQKYAHYLKEHIFNPAGLTNTIVYDESLPMIPDRATGYNKMGELDDYSILTTGDGGIYSTTNDLYQWQQQLNKGSLVSYKELQNAYLPATLNDGRNSNYGFGWNISTSQEGRIVSHTGGLDGFRAIIWKDLKNNNVVIVLTNQGDAFPMQTFMNDIIEML